MTCAAGCERRQQPAAAVAPPVVHAAVGPLPGLEAEPATTANPFRDDKGALGQGRRFFVAYNCAGCHGDHGGGGMGPSLRDHVWLYGSSDAQIADSIARGRGFGMPAWEKMLTPAQIWQITAYIKSMRTASEPQPPM
jgi:cytochrome c oxidase cbb3-type subunit 3